MAGIQALFARPVDAFLAQDAFCCGRVGFALAADEPAVLAEIRHYLASCPLDQAQAETWEVVFVVNPELEQALRRHAGASAARAYVRPELVYAEARFDAMTVLVSERGYERYEHTLAINPALRRVVVIGAHRDEQILRTPLRIVREIALRSLENRGGCFTHAAVVCSQNGAQGALIVGAKSQGKSTTMVNMLLAGSAAYVANDRCVLLADHGRLEAYAWPLSVRIGIGTIAGMAGRASLAEGDYQRRQLDGVWRQRMETAADAAAHWGTMKKLELTPLELSQRLGAEIRPSGAITAVVLPALRLDGGVITLSPCPPAEARDAVAAALCEPEDVDYLRGWLGLRTISDHALTTAAAEICDALLELPLWRLTGDPRLMAGSGQLLRSILGGPASTLLLESA